MISLKKTLILLVLSIWMVKNQDNMAISGYIEMGKEALKEAEIELYDLNGQLIDRSVPTEGGYYLLPIMEKENYLLKMKNKHGLNFKPPHFPIFLKDKTDP